MFYADKGFLLRATLDASLCLQGEYVLKLLDYQVLLFHHLNYQVPVQFMMFINIAEWFY